eukprot:TRINITY_DN16408_c0_g2_i11.p1 TRINITY_DN16408_c0_g2~~TRINITY_DN16408_c0_g2_i11.p1  ORF type:complete len:201 (-),score=22.62 TRINITY_DN16408_c0_g2_i11:145-747(-)
MPEHNWETLLTDYVTKENVQELMIAIVRLMISSQNSPELDMNIFNIIPDFITCCTASVAYEVTMQVYAKAKQHMEAYKHLTVDPENRVLYATTNGVYCLARLGMKGLVFPFLGCAQTLCEVFEKALNQEGNLSVTASVCMGVVLDKDIQGVTEEMRSTIKQMIGVLLGEDAAPEIAAAAKYCLCKRVGGTRNAQEWIRSF